MGPLDDNRTVSLTPGIFPPLAPGTLLQGRYRIESQIGKGGMGFVYIVRDERFSSSLGIRSIRSLKEMIPRVNEVEQAKYMLNFRREAEVLESLRHPNIPRIYDWFEQSNRAYLVLDYIEGMDLEQVRDKTPGLLDPHMVVNWMVQLCKIVQYLHEHRPDPIIFRDLKPSNVILTPDQRIELIDFGIARTFRSADPQTNIGTQGYAAPEMYDGKAEPRSDVYTLGAMMHHLLTNTDPRLCQPFTFQRRPPRRSNPEVSAKLEHVIMKAVEQEPSKRYQTVVELRIALQEALGLPETNSMPSVSPGASSPIRTWGVAATMNTQSDGKKLWEFQTEEEVRAKPAVINGMVLVGSYDSNLYA
ncbi:MAG: protein kinase domain-containing protein, partial [Ktedonobacterales bacterium]